MREILERFKIFQVYFFVKRDTYIVPKEVQEENFVD